MWVANGSFDSDHTPHVDCILSAYPPERGRELPLANNDTFKMADGRRVSLLSVSAYVQIGERCREVPAVLQPKSSEVLVGVALLRALNLALLLTRDKVLVLDQDSIEDVYDSRPGHRVIRDSATASAA